MTESSPSRGTARVMIHKQELTANSASLCRPSVDCLLQGKGWEMMQIQERQVSIVADDHKLVQHHTCSEVPIA